MDLVRSVVCGMEAHLQVTWAIMKSDKLLYKLFHISNTANDDHMKDFDA